MYAFLIFIVCIIVIAPAAILNCHFKAITLTNARKNMMIEYKPCMMKYDVKENSQYVLPSIPQVVLSENFLLLKDLCIVK